MKKRICYVVTTPVTIRAFFLPQIRYLAERGMDITVVCTPEEKLAHELRGYAAVYPVEMPRGISVLGSVWAVGELIRFFRRERFDLIQYSTPNAALYAAAAAFLTGCRRRNYHLMGFRYLGAEGIGRRLLKAAEWLTCRLSTSIECVSPSNLALGVREGIFPPEKATVVGWGSSGGVDLQRFSPGVRRAWRGPMRQRYGYTEDEMVFGFVGRITKDKGVGELLEAFAAMESGAKLFVIGPREDAALWKRAEETENVTVAEAADEIERYYALLDVLVLPSHREGFGNVVAEAGAMGLAAIITDIPGPVDAVSPGQTALVVPPGDVQALRRAMETIRQRDYRAMGQQAAVLIRRRFDSDKLNREIYRRKCRLLAAEEKADGKAFGFNYHSGV